MQPLTFKNYSIIRLLVIPCFAAMVMTIAAGAALAVGLTYVDGDAGVNSAPNLAPLSNIALSDDPPATNDGLWSYRSDGGVANPGDIFKSVYEASGGNNPEDAPEINQTLSGLTPNTSYDVYVVYWQGAQSGFDWNVRAGFSSGNLTLFNTKGPTSISGAVAGAPALHHEWTSAVPTNPTDGQITFFEAGRTLLLGQVGSTTSSGGGNLTVFIDDLPTTAESGPSGTRSWFEGLAYVPAGTTVFRAPGDFNLMNGVDAADASTFLDTIHIDVSSMNVLQTYLLGDLNADLAINHTDFVLFKDAYETDNGAGSFDRLMAGVPEPTSAILLLIGFMFFVIQFHRKRHQFQFAYHRVNTMNRVKKLLAGVIVASLFSAEGIAAPVTDWFAIVPGTGAASTKPTSNLNTAAPTLGDGTASSAAQVALWSDISGALDAAADVSLANGQRITLSGSATLTGIVEGGASNEQFRFGLFNDNTAAPFDSFGWGGYIPSNSSGGSGGNLRAKDYDAATTFAQTGSAISLQVAQDGDVIVNGTYSFSMAISRFDNELSIDATLSNGAGFLQEWRSAIAAPPDDPVIFDYNRVGFLSGNPMAADQIQFNNIDVTVDAAEALTLRVSTAGPNAGAVQIRNNSGIDFDIDYYEITSAAGSLNLTGWNSLDDQEGGDPELQGWDEVPASDANLLSEIILEPDASVLVTPSAFLSLGSAFNVGGVQDLKFSFGLADGTLARGIVEYVTSTVLAGDYNEDGTVDAADYVVWRRTGINGPNGYNIWRTNFGANNGAGASNGAAAVPEPAALALIVLGLASLATVRRCERRV